MNCLKTAAEKLEHIETLEGEEKFKKYAALFKNSLAINLNLLEKKST